MKNDNISILSCSVYSIMAVNGEEPSVRDDIMPYIPLGYDGTNYDRW